MANFVIHKHIIRMDPGIIQHVEMATGAEFLSLGVQRGNLVIWERHDIEASGTVTRPMVALFTGQEFKDGSGWRWIHLGTVQDEDGWVWHLFEM